MPMGMLGKYEKLDVLGHGASGIVYLAKDTLLGRQVALKVVNIQAGDMHHFLEEARVLDRLRHPNIVRVHNVDRIDGNIVLDMEYVRGKNVQEMLREHGPMPLDYALEIAAQTLDALDYAHRMQTVHRDIKPANILISRDGEVKLVDFGLAEILATNAYAGGAGTYAYMAPEDFAEEHHSDHLSDIWAVGITLFEMLTGRRPFQVARPKDPFSWKRVLEQERPARLADYLPDATTDLQHILDRALAFSKSQRYQTAAAFRDAIRLQQQGLSSETSSRTVTARSRFDLTSQATAVPIETRTVPTPPAQRRSAIAVPAEVAVPSPLKSEVSADFGMLHEGETRERSVTLLSARSKGLVSGRIVQSPSWITARPTQFDRSRQTIRLTACAPARTEPGELRGQVRFEIDGASGDIPVTMRLLPARRTFGNIALWFLPAFAATLMPAIAILVSANGSASMSRIAQYVPAAASASALLSLMLLLVGLAADLGPSERIACGFVSVAMGAVLGVSSTHWQPGIEEASFRYTLLTAAPLGGMLFLQLLSMRKWAWWACVIAGCGLFCAACLFLLLK